VLTIALWPAASQASLTLTTPPMGNTGTDNVLFNVSDTNSPNTTVYGSVQNDPNNTYARFDSTQILTADGGQANVQPTSPDTSLTNIVVSAVAPGPSGSAVGFNALIFNAFGDGFMNIGAATLTVVTDAATYSTDSSKSTDMMNDFPSFTIGNGNNFYRLDSTGELIVSVSISVAGSSQATGEDASGFVDLRQIRMGGISNFSTVTADAPEPSTLALTAIGLACSAGYWWRRRKTQQGV
jgi:hypothetical protein